MKLIKYTLYSLLALMILTTGCSGLKEVKIGKIKNVEFKGINNNVVTLSITVPVDNPNPYRFKIKSKDLKVMAGNTEFGKIKQMQDIVIHKNSSQDYPVQLTVELTNVQGNLFSLYRTISSNKNNLKLTGKVKIRSLFYCKTLNMEDYQLVY